MYLCTFAVQRPQFEDYNGVLPRQDAREGAELYEWDQGGVEVTTKELTCDPTLGLRTDGKIAIGINITGLVATLGIPHSMRRKDAFEMKGIILVDSSLIPYMPVQQNLTKACMADWTKVLGENQGLTIE